MSLEYCMKNQCNGCKNARKCEERERRLDYYAVIRKHNRIKRVNKKWK